MTSSYLRTGMNTGLGDYIHLKKENYLRYGFFRSGGSSSPSFAVSTACAYRDIRNLIIAKVQRNGNTRLLEILLTDFYRQNLSSDNAYAQWAGVNTQNIAQQEQSLAAAVEEKMPQYFVFNRDAMTVENPSAFKSKGEKMYKLKNGQKKISINSLKKIYTRLRQTQTYLTRILNTGNVKNVAVSQTGCNGMCQYEPIVEVFEPGKEKVTYVQMTAEKAVKVITEHVVNGKPVAEYTVGAVTE